MIVMPRSDVTFVGILLGFTRDGACGGPLKRAALSIPGGDLSGKVL